MCLSSPMRNYDRLDPSAITGYVQEVQPKCIGLDDLKKCNRYALGTVDDRKMADEIDDGRRLLTCNGRIARGVYEVVYPNAHSLRLMEVHKRCDVAGGAWVALGRS